MDKAAILKAADEVIASYRRLSHEELIQKLKAIEYPELGIAFGDELHLTKRGQY